MAWLRKKLKERLINCKAEVELAPHLSDPNQPDFFRLRFFKDNFYQGTPRTIAALKAAIAEKIQPITQEECAQQLCTQHSTVLSTERQISGAFTQGLLLTFLINA